MLKPEIFTWTHIDPIGQVLGIPHPFSEFVSVCGCVGLARSLDDTTVELLAVASTQERKGQIREFIRLLKEHYQTICVWFIENPVLFHALKRYDFKPAQQTDSGTGDSLVGLRWDRQKGTKP